MKHTSSPPPLKQPTRYGFYPRWPQDGDDWIHPEDVTVARNRFPSQQIWRRDSEQGNYGGYHLIHHGQDCLRVKSVLWQEIDPPEFEIGDWVEVRTKMYTHQPHTGQVVDLVWDQHRNTVVYHIEENDQKIVETYIADDLKSIQPPTSYFHSTLPSDTPEATEGIDELLEGLDQGDFGPPNK